jgi:hypothetical protein
VQGCVDGVIVTVGNPRLFSELSMDVPPALRDAVEAAADAGRTAVMAGWDGTARGKPVNRARDLAPWRLSERSPIRSASPGCSDGR